MEIDFIKELFSGKKIYLTTDLSDIFKIQISRRPGYLMNGTLNSNDAWRPITVFTKRHIYYGVGAELLIQIIIGKVLLL